MVPAVLTPSVSSTSTRAAFGSADKRLTATAMASPMAVSLPARPTTAPCNCARTADRSQVSGVTRNARVPNRIKPSSSPPRRLMKSPAIASTAVKRSTVCPPSSMSGVRMLPDRSTASIIARPLCACACGGPIHCGRAAASSRHSQPSTSSHAALPAGRARIGADTANPGCGRCNACPGAAGRSQRRSNHGSGSSTAIHGQANSGMRRLRAFPATARGRAQPGFRGAKQARHVQGRIQPI